MSGTPISPEPIRPTPDRRKARIGEFGIRLPANDDPLSEPQLKLHRLMSAVQRAQQVIDRQQKRIAYLESLSVTDELTGAANRRGFKVELRKSLAEAKRTGRGGVLVMIDLDRFKQINDRFGHAAGDAVLGMVAGVLQGYVRRSDTVARLGGDEFAVIMPETSPDQGRLRAGELDRLLNGLIVPYDGHAIPVHGSVGLEIYKPGAREADVTDSADRKMYRTKQAKQPRQARAS
jgi:diguanylate cyclase (GGDEF)-like protein